jgi:hypothetical protein
LVLDDRQSAVGQSQFLQVLAELREVFWRQVWLRQATHRHEPYVAHPAT